MRNAPLPSPPRHVEESFERFHFSAVVWLDEHGVAFDGGRLSFVAAERADGVELDDGVSEDEGAFGFGRGTADREEGDDGAAGVAGECDHHNVDDGDEHDDGDDGADAPTRDEADEADDGERSGAQRAAAAWLSVEPRPGRGALFSAGWENAHRVEVCWPWSVRRRGREEGEDVG